MFDVWISERGTGAGSCAGEAVRALLAGDTNHVHLLVKDTAGEAIAQSMQLIAGRTRGSWFKVQRFKVKGQGGSKLSGLEARSPALARPLGGSRYIGRKRLRLEDLKTRSFGIKSLMKL